MHDYRPSVPKKEHDTEVKKLKQEIEQLKNLACEKCKLTKMAFVCRINDKKCIANGDD